MSVYTIVFHNQEGNFAVARRVWTEKKAALSWAALDGMKSGWARVISRRSRVELYRNVGDPDPFAWYEALPMQTTGTTVRLESFS